jgi:hypothetical protein
MNDRKSRHFYQTVCDFEEEDQVWVFMPVRYGKKMQGL